MLTSKNTNQVISQASSTQPTALVASNTDYSLITYPIPSSALASKNYSLSVNKQPVFVQQYNSINYAHFAFAGKADIEVLAKENVTNYVLSPKSYNIRSKKDGNKISFSLVNPSKLIFHKVNGQSEELYIFADPLEDNAPHLGDANVSNLLDYGIDNTGINDVTDKIQQAINDVSNNQGVLYISPGIYKTKQLNLKSNMTMYLAGGAVLEATKEIKPSDARGVIHLENVSNVKIMGRGVIYGNGSYWRNNGGWYSLIQLVNTTNIDLEDILLIDSAAANFDIQYTDNCTIYNAKILADPKPIFANTDGFDFWSSRNITIDNVIFRGTDDATSHGGDKKAAIKDNENINVKNSIFYNTYAGGAFKIGTTVRQDFIRNITYENIDLVYVNALADLWPVTGANFDNIYFKNIRVEEMLDTPIESGTASLFEWRITPANWEENSSFDTLGYIRNIYFTNLIVDDRGGKDSLFEGYDSKRDIRNIIFDNFYIQGKQVFNDQDAHFQRKNQYVDVKFQSSNPTIININASKMYASKLGETGEFNITRTGDISQVLTVNYKIRGTAENSRDYQTIPTSVTFPAGVKELTIPIQAQTSQDKKGLLTVDLSLENLPNSNEYLIGPYFRCIVNIKEE